MSAVAENWSVTIQLYSSTKPAIPHRTWISATSLLLAALILALIMTWQRAGGITAPRFEPDGWAISFQPPSGFRGGQGMLTPVGPAYQFGTLQDDGTAIILTVTRAGLDPTDQPLDICKRVFRTFLASGTWHGDLALTDETKKIGPLRAVELWDPDPSINNIIVRAATLEDDDAYAISLYVQKGEVEPAIYKLFEEACSSVALQTK
jgi:hypothetical protein